LAELLREFLHYGEEGDYVLQSTTDPADVWIVKRELFEATYDFATRALGPDRNE